MLDFKIIKLNINQSYFFGEVEFRSDVYKVNIQNERRGKVLKLPFEIKSKSEKILPLGLTDNAVLKKEVNKDEVIKIDDVELNLPGEVIEARDYQYNLI